MSEDDTVEVIISARQVTWYRARRKIPRAMFEEYERMIEDSAVRDRDFARVFGELVEGCGADYGDLEDITIDIAKVKT
jgi:hypothetical protein